MMIEKVMSRSLRVVFAGGLALGMHAVQAQDDGGAMQKVEITGSSIKRLAAESSLPVQLFSQKDIKRSGATTVADFVQQLPAMQNFTVAADSVGGAGGGVTSASIHDLGEVYTLVLLNGRRIAAATSGTTIDLNSIPLSAIERIEVLTDGASALYGADAIAGVVNFILKKGNAPLEVTAKYGNPQHKGGNSDAISISKGFGDIDDDGYSLFVSLSHDKTRQIKAADRPFAKTGIINFTDPKTGRALQFFNGSGRAVPPNVEVGYNNGSDFVNLNPYALAHGGCAPFNVNAFNDGNCYYDYTSTIEISPQQSRDALFASGSLKLGDSGFNAFFDAAYTEAKIVARIAPYPADFALSTSSPLYASHVLPYLTAEQAANVSDVTTKYRLYDMGNRGYDYGTKATHLVAGVDGKALGWDINSALTYSKNKQNQQYIGGFPLAQQFNDLVDAGLIDPFAYQQGEMPKAMRDLLLSTQYLGSYSTQSVEMKAADARASRDLFKLAGGAALLGVGVDYRSTAFRTDFSPVAKDALILFDSVKVDNHYKRDNGGAYGELIMPVSKQLELTTSVRYDTIGAVKDKLNGATFGSSESAATYKISGKFQPTPTMLFRAAAGTGFRTAAMSQIAQPVEDFGVTAGTYACPFTADNGLAGNALARYCKGRGQVEVFKGGNADLKPEKSKQWSFGTVIAPFNSVTMSLDVWNVQIRDQISEVNEGTIFANPAKYLNLFTTKHFASTGLDALAIKLLPINISKAESRGIDYNFTHRMKLLDGTLSNSLSGTYLLRSRYTAPGDDGDWETSLNRYGSNEKVSFRNVLKLTSAFETAKFTHTLSANYRNGYRDKHYDTYDCAVTTNDAAQECADVMLDVPSYLTFDLQSVFRPMPNVEITGGILNIADRNPPFSLRSAGPHQLGYNPSYSSAVGRSFYVSGSYKF